MRNILRKNILLVKIVDGEQVEYLIDLSQSVLFQTRFLGTIKYQNELFEFDLTKDKTKKQWDKLLQNKKEIIEDTIDKFDIEQGINDTLEKIIFNLNEKIESSIENIQEKYENKLNNFIANITELIKVKNTNNDIVLDKIRNEYSSTVSELSEINHKFEKSMNEIITNTKQSTYSILDITKKIPILKEDLNKVIKILNELVKE